MKVTDLSVELIAWAIEDIRLQTGALFEDVAAC